MSLYKEIVSELNNDNLIEYLYRFQGGNSYPYLNKNGRIKEEDKSKYIYFSRTLDHHLYFSLKRIKQFLNGEVFDENYALTLKNLSNTNKFLQMKKMISYYVDIEDFKSIKLIVNSIYLDILKDNYYYQEKKELPYIEKVDRKVFGGGYGISEEWIRLLNYLTYFTLYREIDRYDLIDIISVMRKTGKISKIDNLKFIIESSKYCYTLNNEIFNDFLKFDIVEVLESIIDKKIYNPNSELSKNPTKTIKEVVNSYQKGREKTLKLLKNKEKILNI